MFPSNGGPPVPFPAPRYYEFNHRSPARANSVIVPELGRLPVYNWKPKSPALPPLPPRGPVMTNGRKRQHDDYNGQASKRQRLDSLYQPPIDSPLILTPTPLRRADQLVAGPSRSGFDLSFSSPHSHPHLQAPAVPQSSNSLQTYAKDKLSSQMVALFEACEQKSSDLAWKEMCRTRLHQDIQRIFPAARLYLTGSSMNGLGCRSSDADLCLVIKAHKRVDAIHVLSVIQQLFNSLPYIRRSQLIRAKVPILKFREKDSDLEFDLNVNSTVGIRNTFLLRSYAYADLRIRPMILVIKKWAQHYQINDASKGTLSSYTLVLMVLHYLQTLKEPVLPSLQRDYPECFDPCMEIDMVPERSKRVPLYISRNQASLGELLLGFLKYYATNFSWDNQVISIREARTFPKNSSKEWRNKFICVEDPFERSNVARAVHEKIKFDAIRTQFVESSRVLQQRRDLNSIIPVRGIINNESPRRRGIPLISRADGDPSTSTQAYPQNRSLTCAERGVLPLQLPARKTP